MSLLALRLDPDTARHAAVALRAYRRSAERAGIAVPEQLEDLEHLLTEAASSGHEQSGALSRRTGPEHRPGDHDEPRHAGREWLSPSEAAAMTGLSIATVRRRLADESIPSRLVGRRRLIHRSHLEFGAATA